LLQLAFNKPITRFIFAAQPTLVAKKILIADDENDILEIISFNLLQHGYQVVTAKNGNEAIEKARAEKPDLIILDVMMPFKNGIEVCNILRLDAAFSKTLIIFLSALHDEVTEVKGLETGADDYLTKPISPKILLSKIAALFRRVDDTKAEIIDLGDIAINKESFTVMVKGNEINLPKKEFALLALLASKPGKVFLRNEILSEIWGNEVIVGDRTIDVHVRKIRQKLDMDCISTVKGVGYKFEL
jgi:two-component system, OmpR family, alkaline phosphatase synthesis response regulator PhoP